MNVLEVQILLSENMIGMRTIILKLPLRKRNK